MNDQQVIKSLKKSLQGAGFKIKKLESELETLKEESRVEITDLRSQLIEAQQQLAVEQKSKEHFWQRLKCPTFYKGWLNR